MAKKKPKPGPKAERLKLEGDWKDRLRDTLHKPEKPKPEKKKRG